MENNIRKCPNCIEIEANAYRRGYSDACKLFEKEIMLAKMSRPVVLHAHVKAERLKPVNTPFEEFIEKAHNKIVEDHLKIEEIEHGEDTQ